MCTGETIFELLQKKLKIKNLRNFGSSLMKDANGATTELNALMEMSNHLHNMQPAKCSHNIVHLVTPTQLHKRQKAAREQKTTK